MSSMFVPGLEDRENPFAGMRLPSFTNRVYIATLIIPALLASACSHSDVKDIRTPEKASTKSRPQAIKKGEPGYELLDAVILGRQATNLPSLTDIESKYISEIIRQFHGFIDKHPQASESRVRNHRPRYGIYSQRIAHDQLHWSTPSLAGMYYLNMSDPFNLSKQREDNFVTYEKAIFIELEKPGNPTSLFHSNYFSPSYSTELSYAHTLRALLFVYQASKQGVPVLGFQLPFSKIEYDRHRARIKNPNLAPLTINEIQKIRWKDFPRSNEGIYHHNFLSFVDLAYILKALNISFDVRFLSESEQQNSLYHPPEGPQQFINAFLAFRKAAPSNVRFIFSPCAFSSRTVLGEYTNYGKVPFDYIGGTLYTDMEMGIDKRYSAYYAFMTEQYPKATFRIDEIGAPFKDTTSIKQFLDSSKKKYPQLKHICFFDGQLNEGSKSQQLLGKYGVDFSNHLLRE